MTVWKMSSFKSTLHQRDAGIHKQNVKRCVVHGVSRDAFEAAAADSTSDLVK